MFTATPPLSATACTYRRSAVTIFLPGIPFTLLKPVRCNCATATAVPRRFAPIVPTSLSATCSTKRHRRTRHKVANFSAVACAPLPAPSAKTRRKMLPTEPQSPPSGYVAPAFKSSMYRKEVLPRSPVLGQAATFMWKAVCWPCRRMQATPLYALAKSFSRRHSIPHHSWFPAASASLSSSITTCLKGETQLQERLQFQQLLRRHQVIPAHPQRVLPLKTLHSLRLKTTAQYKTRLAKIKAKNE